MEIIKSGTEKTNLTFQPSGPNFRLSRTFSHKSFTHDYDDFLHFIFRKGIVFFPPFLPSLLPWRAELGVLEEKLLEDVFAGLDPTLFDLVRGNI
jgi:hypothetical protein